MNSVICQLHLWNGEGHVERVECRATHPCAAAIYGKFNYLIKWNMGSCQTVESTKYVNDSVTEGWTLQANSSCMYAHVPKQWTTSQKSNQNISWTNVYVQSAAFVNICFLEREIEVSQWIISLYRDTIHSLPALLVHCQDVTQGIHVV